MGKTSILPAIDLMTPHNPSNDRPVNLIGMLASSLRYP
jgi:hypothetical protein